MLCRTLLISLIAMSVSLHSIVVAHPDHDHVEDSFHQLSTFQVRQSDPNRPFSAARFPEVQKIMQGNAQFRQQRNEAKMKTLVETGQKPPFALITCSDSRVPEATIFNSEPGTFFVERNIANQYKQGDENAQSVINYGVRVLGVQHIVVMGHYGCGGIAAAIASLPKQNIDVSGHIIQSWIGDVRQLYLNSNRSEIVEMRDANQAREANGELVEEPDHLEAGFRALVEENVKIQVQRLASSSLIINLNAEIIANVNPDGTPRNVEGGKAPDEGGETPAEGGEGAAPAEGGAEGGERPAESGTAEGSNTEGGAEEGQSGEEVGVPPEGGKAGDALPLIPVFIHGWVHDIETGEVIDLNISIGPAGFENFVPRPAEGDQGEGEGEGGKSGEQAPAEGDEQPAEGGELPAVGEGGSNEGGSGGSEGENGSTESGSVEGETSASISVKVIGVSFKSATSSSEAGARAERRSFSRSRRSRQILQNQARHDAKDDAQHDHQARQYPPAVKMFKRKCSALPSSQSHSRY